MGQKQKKLSGVYAENFKLQPLSVKQLMELYGVSRTTIRKWIEPFKDKVGKRIGWYYNLKQVDTIIQQLGLPEQLEKY